MKKEELPGFFKWTFNKWYFWIFWVLSSLWYSYLGLVGNNYTFLSPLGFFIISIVVFTYSLIIFGVFYTFYKKGYELGRKN